MKAKTIDDAFWKIVQMWPRSPTRETLEGILGEVYEAGRKEAFTANGPWQHRAYGFCSQCGWGSCAHLLGLPDSDGGECD